MRVVNEEGSNMNNKKRMVKLIIASLILLLLFSITLTYGRYIYNAIKDVYLASKKFYFNSDKLTSNHKVYRMDNWSGVDTYQLSINLNNSKNNLEFANSDITYALSYTCSDNANCSISKTEGTIITNEITDNFTATISAKNALKNNDEVWIEIVAESTYPYKKTLSATFILKVGVPGISYEISDEKSSPYFNLSVTNSTNYYLVKTAFLNYEVDDRIDSDTYNALSDENKAKCALPLITLSFDPEVVIIDMTSTVFQNKESYTTTQIGGYDYVNSISFRINLESSEIVKFYKADTSQNYTYPIVNDSSIVSFSYTQ